MIKVSILLEATTRADYMRLSGAFDAQIVTPPDVTNNDRLSEEIKLAVFEFLRRRHGFGHGIIRQDIIVVAVQVMKDET